MRAKPGVTTCWGLPGGTPTPPAPAWGVVGGRSGLQRALEKPLQALILGVTKEIQIFVLEARPGAGGRTPIP